MTGPKERGIAYSLILCASLSMNCLTNQAVWALDSADASKAAPPVGAAAAGTPAATAPAVTTSAGTAPATPPAGGSSAAATAAPTASAPATTSNTVAPTAAGPLQADRNKIRNWMLAAQKRGVGIGGYVKVYDDMESSVRAGEPQANIKKKVDSICRAIADQYHTSAKIARDRRPGVRTGGSEVIPFLYDGPNEKFRGKQLDQGVVSENVEIEYKKALEKLRREESTGQFQGDAIEARRDMNRQRELNQWKMMDRMRTFTSGKVTSSRADIDDIRRSNTGSYYEKSKLRKEQTDHANEVYNRYNKKDWIPPPPNENDY